MKTLIAAGAGLLLMTSGSFARLTIAKPADTNSVKVSESRSESEAARQREADYFRAPQTRSTFEMLEPCSGARPRTIEEFLRRHKACD